jgi:hypothetical protein
MTQTSTPSSDLRIGEKIKAALRRNYRAAAKKHPPRTIAQQNHLAIATVAALDPMGRLGLSTPADAERLQKLINYMTR